MSGEGWRLYADAGNTALKWAARAAGAWSAEGRLPIEALTGEPRAVGDEIAGALVAAGFDPTECAGVALVCSRPSEAEAAENALRAATGAEVALLGRDLQAAVRSTYADPSEIGQDRLALAEGALALVGAPVIVIAAGTCVTAQWLDAEAVMVGGAIAAGIEAQVEGIGEAVPHLREAAARAAELLRGDAVAGGPEQSTVRSLESGLGASLLGTVRALCEQAREEVGDAPIVATGGDAELARKLGAQFDRVEALLVLEGLRVVDERSR